MGEEHKERAPLNPPLEVLPHTYCGKNRPYILILISPVTQLAALGSGQHQSRNTERNRVNTKPRPAVTLNNTSL